jgi:hypothetical protein
LSAVLSDILGFSGKRILQALCAGETDPARLAKLMHPGVKATEEQVIAALTAEVREHHRFLLRELLELIEVQDRSVSHLEAEIERHLSSFEEEMERCERYPAFGSGPGCACRFVVHAPGLREQDRRLKKRRGSKRAALAVGHSILVIYYQMMKTGEEYHEKGMAFFARHADQGKIEQQLTRRLERMGYQVTRSSQAVA